MTWNGLGDGRVNDLWQRAGDLSRKRSEKIPDQGLRKMFLERLPAHRAILESATRG